MKNISDYIYNALVSERGYSGLFKAGVFILAAAVIAISQVGMFLYDKDIAAHERAFSIEAVAGKAIKQPEDCLNLNSDIFADCKMVIHEMKNLDLSINLLKSFFKVSFVLGGLLLLISLTFFIAAAFKNN